MGCMQSWFGNEWRELGKEGEQISDTSVSPSGHFGCADLPGQAAVHIGVPRTVHTEKFLEAQSSPGSLRLRSRATPCFPPPSLGISSVFLSPIDPAFIIHNAKCLPVT